MEAQDRKLLVQSGSSTDKLILICSSSEKTMWERVQRRNVLAAKCTAAKCARGEMSKRRNFLAAKCPAAKRSAAKCRAAKIPRTNSNYTQKTLKSLYFVKITENIT